MLFLLSGFSWTDDDLSAIFPVSTLLFKLFWNNRNPFWGEVGKAPCDEDPVVTQTDAHAQYTASLSYTQREEWLH